MTTAPRDATLTLVRTSAGDVAERQVNVSLDGTHVATLLYGDSVTMRVAPGAHTLRANNTLVWKSVAFEVTDGGGATFEIVNRPGFGTRTLVALIGVGPLYLTVNRLA